MLEIHRHGGMMAAQSDHEHEYRGLPTAVQQLRDVVAAINAMSEDRLTAHRKEVNALNQQMVKLTETLETHRPITDEWLARVMAW
jgi:hypothetical protein